MKMNFLLLISLSFNTAFGQDFWIQRDSVNGPPRAAAASFELNGEAFVLTGVDVEGFKRKMYSFDLEQNDWDNESALGGEAGAGLERGSAVGFSIAGKGYLALGSASGIYMKDLWQYDPEAETWTQMADFAGSARGGAIAFSIDEKAYAGFGQDAGGLKNDFYSYDPATNTWDALDDFSGDARKEAVGFTMGGKGYMGTGRGSGGYLADFWEYNPLSDTWTRKADFPGTPRFGAVGCGVFPLAYIMLGEDNDFEYRKDVWEYNYFGNIWTQRADYLGGTRTQASAIVVNDRIFVGLGYNGIYHDDFYEYERVLSLENEQLGLNFKLYPNPFIAHFTIQLPENVEGLQIKIYNTAGSDISNQFSFQQSTNGQIAVTLLDNLAPGNYFITLGNESTVFGSKKIGLVQ